MPALHMERQLLLLHLASAYSAFLLRTLDFGLPWRYCRRSFVQGILTPSSPQRPTMHGQTCDSMRPDPPSAMAHPLWDSPDSPLQAGIVSTMPDQPRMRSDDSPHRGSSMANGLELSSQGRPESQWAAPRQTASWAANAPSDPTLNGLRARYSLQQAGSGLGPDALPGSGPIDSERIYRPSVAAAQWDGVAGALPRRSQFVSGPDQAHEGTPRNTMMPQRPSEMRKQQDQQRGSYMEAPNQLQQPRPSVAAATSQQPRMSSYGQASPRQATWGVPDGYPLSGDQSSGYSPSSDAEVGGPTRAAYQNGAQQGPGPLDQSHLARMRSSGVRQSMLARPSMGVQHGGHDGSSFERSLFQHRWD